jgi:hypothetical protein
MHVMCNFSPEKKKKDIFSDFGGPLRFFFFVKWQAAVFACVSSACLRLCMCALRLLVALTYRSE